MISCLSNVCVRVSINHIISVLLFLLVLIVNLIEDKPFLRLAVPAELKGGIGPLPKSPTVRWISSHVKVGVIRTKPKVV